MTSGVHSFAPRSHDYRQNSIIQPAFTLIELLVVIAIISLLVSILLPSLNKAKELAQEAVCMTRQRTLLLALSLYASDNNDQLPGFFGNDTLNRERVGQYILLSRSVLGLGWLYYQGYVPSGTSFYCPSRKGYFSEKEGPWPWGDFSDSSVTAVASSYVFRNVYYWQNMAKQTGTPISDPTSGGRLSAAATGLAAMSDMCVWISTFGMTHPDKLNVGYFDGHVSAYWDNTLKDTDWNRNLAGNYLFQNELDNK